MNRGEKKRDKEEEVKKKKESDRSKIYVTW